MQRGKLISADQITQNKSNSMVIGRRHPSFQSERNVQDINQQGKSSSITVFKSFFGEKNNDQNTTSSLVTIFATLNLMSGGLVLLIPGNYLKSGILLSSIAMIIIALLSWKTLSWIIIVSKGRSDIEDILIKYTGRLNYKLYRFSSFCLNFGSGIIYFSLLISTTFQILEILFAFMGIENYAKKSEFTFQQFSVQWLSLIIFVVTFPLLFLQKLTFLIQMGKIGALSIYAFIILILYLFIQNISNGAIQEYSSEIKLFTPNISYILGNFALAFVIHDSITEMMSTNRYQENNVRDSKFVYGISLSLFAIIGVVGSYALLGRQTSVKDPQSIFDYFENDKKSIPILIVAILNLIHLISTYPLLCFLSRKFLVNLIQGNQEPSMQFVSIFNSVYALAGLSCVIFNVDPNIIVGLIGTIFGFILVYFIPILLRILQKSILENDEQQGINIQLNDNLQKWSQNDVVIKIKSMKQSLLEFKKDDSIKQNILKQLKQQPLRLKLGFIILLLVGITLTVIQILQLFNAI